MDNNSKALILIVDDNEINRDILSTMLENEYQIITAVNGKEALQLIEENLDTLSLIMLDIHMPVMNGFDVLTSMNIKGWIKRIPVIMISSENNAQYINKTYELGATDFIQRPFDTGIIHHRINNTLGLFNNIDSLKTLVLKQSIEKEKRTGLMINILSHVIECINFESGSHILRINNLTRIILESLIRQTNNKYNLTDDDVENIVLASSLHDIGKIAISNEIINKPGRLTKEEFEVMKTHSLIGAKMIESLTQYKDEPLVKYAYEICRWHHEKYDGKGYPDGLVGEQIPISAQVTSLADVYDALTSERIYKPAYPHEQAIRMILNKECGEFNPVLIDCLKESEYLIKNAELLNSVKQKDDIVNSTKRLLEESKINSTEIKEDLQLLKEKGDFLFEYSNEIFISYSLLTQNITVSKFGCKVLDIPKSTFNPKTNDIYVTLTTKEIQDIVKNLLDDHQERTLTFPMDYTYKNIRLKELILFTPKEENENDRHIFGKINFEEVK